MGWGIIGKGIWVSSGSLITLWVTIIRSVTCTLSFVSVLAPPHSFEFPFLSFVCLHSSPVYTFSFLTG